MQRKETYVGTESTFPTHSAPHILVSRVVVCYIRAGHLLTVPCDPALKIQWLTFLFCHDDLPF